MGFFPGPWLSWLVSFRGFGSVRCALAPVVLWAPLPGCLGPAGSQWAFLHVSGSTPWCPLQLGVPCMFWSSGVSGLLIWVALFGVGMSSQHGAPQCMLLFSLSSLFLLEGFGFWISLCCIWFSLKVDGFWVGCWWGLCTHVHKRGKRP